MPPDSFESDWKKLREIRKSALQRFCRKVLDQASAIVSDAAASDAHATYLKLYECVTENDKTLGYLFNDWRRSTITSYLPHWFEEGLFTEDELGSLSPELQARIQQLWKMHYKAH